MSPVNTVFELPNAILLLYRPSSINNIIDANAIPYETFTDIPRIFTTGITAQSKTNIAHSQFAGIILNFIFYSLSSRL